jgi:hypothetical protein
MSIVEIKRLYDRARNPRHPDCEFSKQEIGRLPQELQTALENVPTHGNEFFHAYCKATEVVDAAKAKKAEEARLAEAALAAAVEGPEEETADDSILPFPGFAGYGLDSWGRPHGIGGQRRKRGPLAAVLRWKPRKKGQKPRFIYGYQLSVGGKRVFKSALTCGIARWNAQRALWDTQLEDGD